MSAMLLELDDMRSAAKVQLVCHSAAILAPVWRYSVFLLLHGRSVHDQLTAKDGMEEDACMWQ